MLDYLRGNARLDGAREGGIVRSSSSKDQFAQNPASEVGLDAVYDSFFGR